MQNYCYTYVFVLLAESQNIMTGLEKKTFTGMQQAGGPGGRGPPTFWQIRRRRRAAAARRITTGPPRFLTLGASLRLYRSLKVM